MASNCLIARMVNELGLICRNHIEWSKSYHCNLGEVPNYSLKVSSRAGRGQKKRFHNFEMS